VSCYHLSKQLLAKPQVLVEAVVEMPLVLLEPMLEKMVLQVPSEIEWPLIVILMAWSYLKQLYRILCQESVL
jgi:hypothetical protein